MRGEHQQQHEMFSYGSWEERIPADHPLRSMRAMVDEALGALDGRFNEIYQADGRKSIQPERLLRAFDVRRGEASLEYSIPFPGRANRYDTWA